MGYQAVFRRYELKYLLSEAQADRLLQAIHVHMSADRYGQTTIRNIYFDTENYQLIRRSLEKPVYKEKLRLRSYSPVSAQQDVFVELKKKYKGVVYKRRLTMPEQSAVDWICLGDGMPVCQIGREIDYFRSFYAGLQPKVFLSYDREAYYCRHSGDLRITLDRNILCRQDGLSLTLPPGGTAILPEDQVLMEVKTPGGLPLWLTQLLTRERIFKTSFSKYGTAYQQLCMPHMLRRI